MSLRMTKINISTIGCLLMTVTKISDHRDKLKLFSLMDELGSEYENALLNNGFKSINFFDSNDLYISKSLLHKLDNEVSRLNDFMVIIDIKHKHGELRISYIAQHDYDDFILLFATL